MRSFEYFAPTKVIFGKDSHLQIGDILKKENCHKVLIHYGGKSAVASGLIDELMNRSGSSFKRSASGRNNYTRRPATAYAGNSNPY